jgi:tetratricopeptide (TPR) repeat protein
MGSRTRTIHELPADSLREIDRVCTRFEDAWTSGARPVLEQFWTDNSTDAHSAAMLKELLLLDLHYRRQRGERMSVEQYTSRFPDQSDLIVEVWTAHLGTLGGTAADAPVPQVHRYDVLRRLGRGGMAAVYLARDPRLGRFVALKLLSAAEAGEHVVARLRAEAQAIARLQHPNIVQIHEIGEHRGQPYLALEYVSGGSLAEWIGGNPRPPPEAARLVETLARAVQAAHERGVVHRDLKPANVLLHRDEDGNVIPKIADFGLAKFLDDADARLAPTQSGFVVGTASYMAPEQAGGDGDKNPVGPATDVYALGAILYELITGRPPFKAATVFETALLVRNREPVSPRQLQPGTPRDLENVCLKCLCKEPARRYTSALELADDLHHFIVGKPVRARPVGPVERTWRWSRRNPLAASLAAAVALALVLGTVVSTSFAIEARRRAAANLRLASEADAKRQQAEAISGYLSDTFRSPDPERDGRGITVVEMLDRAVTKLHEQFADQPLIEADLAAGLGQTYLSLGQFSAAIKLLERSRDLMQKHGRRDDWKTVAPLHLLARAHTAAGNAQQAIPLAEEAHQRMRGLLGDDHNETMQTVNTLAHAYQDAGRLREAVALHERTLAWARMTLGESDPQTLIAMNNVAWVYDQLDEPRRARELYEQALEAFRAKLGPDHYYTLATMNNLASVHSHAGQSDEAIEMFRHVLEAAGRTLGEDHPNTLATMAQLARAYREARRYAEALALAQRAFDLQRTKLGEDHPQTLETLAVLAVTLDLADQRDRALPMFEDVYDRRRRKLGDEHPDTLRSMGGLGRLYHRYGELDRAHALLRPLLEVKQRTAPDDWETFDAKILLGGVLLDMGRLAEAEPLLVGGYEGMVARLQKVPVENRSRLRYALQQVVKLYEARAQPAEAAKWQARFAFLEDPVQRDAKEPPGRPD